MNNKTIVMSLPAKPQNKINIGLMFAPLIMEIIGKKIDSPKMITLNTLHTYQDSKKNVNTYLSNLKEYGFEYDQYFEDSENYLQLLEILKELISNDKVVVKKKNVLKCECKMVEFLKDGLCYDDGKLYTKKGEKIICNNCGHEVKNYYEDVLVINYKKNNNVKVFPKFLSKEMNYFVDLFDGQDIMVSKSRDTGIFININNKKFNIDIEFIWSQLHGILENNDKIMIASNHQVYVMFIINLLCELYNKNNVLFILTPYMDNDTKFQNFDEKIMKLSSTKRKLFMFYSLKWKKKTCSWDYGLYKKIFKLDDNIAESLYDEICKKIFFDDYNDLLEKINLELSTRNIDADLKKIKKIN